MADWLKVAIRAYGDGDYAHITDLGSAEAAYEANHAGDTLFTFLFVELSESEGCDSQEEALRRIDVAIEDLTKVREAIEYA